MKKFLYLIGGLLMAPLFAPLLAPLPSIAQVPVPPPLLVVTPVNQRVTIRVFNDTGATIDYEVIRDTQFRSLGGNSEITLQNLATPTTLTFRRQDGGLLQPSLRSTTAGVLELRLSATPDFDLDRTTLTIDETGGVFLN